MPRLVFGKSLSPDEIAALQKHADASLCFALSRKEGRRVRAFEASAQRCRPCVYRDHCSERRDDLAKGARLREERRAELCASGEKPCAAHEFCGHGKAAGRSA